MKALVCLVPFTVFALANCGTADSETGSRSPGGDDNTTAGNGTVRMCRATCQTAVDCAQSGQPLQDAGHFACNAGKCEWLGCKSANECTVALQSNEVTCDTAPGNKVPTCQATCQTSADCAVSGNALGSAEHFTCDAGKCRWTGCKSTNECKTALGSTKTTCDTPDGAETPVCMPTCQKAADCAIPGSKLNDAGHFACQAGRCKWLGCRSTGECAADLQTTKVVCD